MDGKLPEPLHLSGHSWKAGFRFGYSGFLPRIGQVPARGILLRIAEHSMALFLGSRCRIKGLKNETGKGDYFMLFLCMRICVSMCAYMGDGCISGKIPTAPSVC